MKPGHIVIEGGDLTGKTTMARKLVEWFENYGREVVLVEEPGGTSRGDEIRAMVKDKNSQLSPSDNLKLFTEARQLLWNEVIRPALREGKVVIATRNYWSTIAYQGYGQGLSLDKITEVTEGAMTDDYLHPNLAVILDLDNKERAERKRRRIAAGSDDMVGHDAFEDNDDVEFSTKVRDGYRQIAKQYDTLLVDASGTVDEEFARALKALHDEYVVQ